jgi:hypothetical protein
MGLGSEIRKKPIPDPGSRGQKGTGSWPGIRNTGYKCQKRTDKYSTARNIRVRIFSGQALLSVLSRVYPSRTQGQKRPRIWIRNKELKYF